MRNRPTSFVFVVVIVCFLTLATLGHAVLIHTPNDLLGISKGVKTEVRPSFSSALPNKACIFYIGSTHWVVLFIPFAKGKTNLRTVERNADAILEELP